MEEKLGLNWTVNLNKFVFEFDDFNRDIPVCFDVTYILRIISLLKN
jgi:hypothetical protein